MSWGRMAEECDRGYFVKVCIVVECEESGSGMLQGSLHCCTSITGGDILDGVGDEGSEEFHGGFAHRGGSLQK